MITESEEQENFKRAINTVSPTKRNLARKSYRKARDSGQTHAAAMTTMRTMFTEEEINEIFTGFEKILNIMDKQVVESDEVDGSDKGPIARDSSHTGRKKTMMGTKTLAAKIAEIIVKGNK